MQQKPCNHPLCSSLSSSDGPLSKPFDFVFLRPAVSRSLAPSPSGHPMLLSPQPSTLPQGTVNMNQCIDVIDAEAKTGQKNALCIITPEQEYFIRGENKEIINGYGQIPGNGTPQPTYLSMALCYAAAAECSLILCQLCDLSAVRSQSAFRCSDTAGAAGGGFRLLPLRHVCTSGPSALVQETLLCAVLSPGGVSSWRSTQGQTSRTRRKNAKWSPQLPRLIPFPSSSVQRYFILNY